MINKALRYFLLLAVITIWLTICLAGQQGSLKFQGVLHDSSGLVAPDGKYAVQFAIYNNSVEGNILWKSATYTIIETSNGAFECTLGETNGLPDSLDKFGSMWLEITSGTGEIGKSRLPIIVSDIVWDSAEANRSQPPPSETSSTGWVKSKKAPAGGFIIKFGRDIEGDHKLYAGGHSEVLPVDIGTMMALEAYWRTAEKPTMIGGGLEIELPRPITNYIGDFQFVSFYGAIKIKVCELLSQNDYFTVSGKIGYGFLFGDTSYKGTLSLGGGLHMGAGVGALIQNLIVVEAFYVANKGSMAQHGNKLNIQYSRISLTTGVYLGK